MNERNKIWTPESDDSPEKVVLSGAIITAVYHKDLGQLAVSLKMEDGSKRSGIIFANAMKFHGRPAAEVPAEEIDAEMEKTAELFRRAKGRNIKLEIHEEQA